MILSATWSLDGRTFDKRGQVLLTGDCLVLMWSKSDFIVERWNCARVVLVWVIWRASALASIVSLLLAASWSFALSSSLAGAFSGARRTSSGGINDLEWLISFSIVYITLSSLRACAFLSRLNELNCSTFGKRKKDTEERWIFLALNSTHNIAAVSSSSSSSPPQIGRLLRLLVALRRP